MVNWLWLIIFLSTIPYSKNIVEVLFEDGSFTSFLLFILILLANLAAISAIIFLLLVQYDLVEQPPKHEECTTAPGTVVIWTNRDASEYYSFFAHDNNNLCMVNNRELFQLGVGYKTESPHYGILVKRQ